MSVKILKNTDIHKENRILYETGMEKLGFFDLKTKKGDTPKCIPFLSIYTPMQEVTPKVVAMAVSTVIRMFSIFFQISCLFIVLNSLVSVFFAPQIAQIFTDYIFIPSGWLIINLNDQCSSVKLLE